MNKENPKIVLDGHFKQVWPHQMGWLKRSDIDHEGMEVWEHPDGRLFAHDPTKGAFRLWIKIK